tara:strand:+ start:3149 stop:3577 length:429 start_codon:yes stop_codon:yes gene_type:complete
MNDTQKKEARQQSYLKYCKSDKGKEARRRALQKYYQKNKEKIIKKNMDYYKNNYSKVIKQKRGTGKKKGANYKIKNGKKVINDKEFTIYTPTFKKDMKKTPPIEDKKYLVKQGDKLFKLTATEIQEKKNNNTETISIMVSFD